MITAKVLWLLLLLVCIRVLWWGFSSSDRTYQFPTIAAAAWLIYIVPQSLGVIVNPSIVPEAVIEAKGLEMALLMSLLCLGAGWFGYFFPKLPKISQFPECSYARLIMAGCLLLGFGYVGFHKLAMLSGGYVHYFSTEGSYTMTWEGLPVIYIFFVKLLYIAVLLFLFVALKRPSVCSWGLVILASLIPIFMTVFLGRRGPTLMLSVIGALTLFFARGVRPRWWLSVVGLLLCAAVVYLGDAYRTHSQIGGDRSQIRQIKVLEILKNVYQGRTYSEFHYAVVAIPAVHTSGRISLGTTIYNQTIQAWVPRVLIGDETKRRLFIPQQSLNELMEEQYGWERPYGTYHTGIADAFREFWFFGAAVFFVLGWGFRWLWYLAKEGKSVTATLLYIILIPLAGVSVIDSINTIIPSTIYAVLFLGPIGLWAEPRRGCVVRKVYERRGPCCVPEK